jgi:hypothetical protein
MEIGWVFLAIVMADGKRFVLQGEGCPHKSVRVVNAAGMGNVYWNPIPRFDFQFYIRSNSCRFGGE